MKDENQEALDGSPASIKSDDGYIWIKFQCGVIPEVEENGTTIRRVIQVLVDRLEGFQKGVFLCRENALAITKLQEAIHWLNHRELDRKARGVEGQHKR